MGNCPARSPKTESQASYKAKLFEPEVIRTIPKPSTKRFEEAALRSNAAEFVPPVHSSRAPECSLSGKLQRTAATSNQEKPRSFIPPTPQIKIDPNEPDWSRYLAKKANVQKVAATGPPGLFVSDKPPEASSFSLQTSDYLKLLQEGEHKGSDRKPIGNQKKRQPQPQGSGPSGHQAIYGSFGDMSTNALKHDLDTLIRGQRQKKQAQQGDAFLRISQMFNPQSVLPEQADPDEEDMFASPTARDDISIERQNQDENLAELVYWSDDDQAPRAIHRASAHKVQHRPRGKHNIREYVTQVIDKELDSQVATLLLHLRRLNDRHRTFEPEVAGRRRYTVGIKEVMRSVRQNKVKSILLAPDIEEMAKAGGLDDRVQDILRVAYEKDIPVVFALSRVRIGNALGKTLRMSVLAILDVTGVTDQFNAMVDYSYEKRVEWLAGQNKSTSPKKQLVPGAHKALQRQAGPMPQSAPQVRPWQKQSAEQVGAKLQRPWDKNPSTALLGGRTTASIPATFTLDKSRRQ